MSTYKTEGIIIKRSNFLESSLLLHIYTKNYGKVETVARSARKAKGKLKGHLELFLDTELILAYGRNIDTITSSLTVESFSNLRNSLEISFGAYYVLELVDKMTIEEHKDERIFYLLKNVLFFLDKMVLDELSLQGVSQDNVANPKLSSLRIVKGLPRSLRLPRNDINILILFFQINLLNLTGFSPELNKCIFCKKLIKSGKNYFSFSMGGIMGQECFFKNPDAVLIDDNKIKLLRLFQFKGGDVKEFNLHLKKSFQIIKKLKANKKLILNSVFLLNKFIEFNIERKIKGVDFLRGV
ncbi:MAG: DNA repair protein RecO [Patescibacteria group bacterium]|nr:DNA repair protein RecO [Patescibacteria group bacterium]